MSKFKRDAIAAFLWTLFGVAGGHMVRLGSNLILTRLLFPEMFGVMAVVNAVVIGITMFSDIGLREGVLHSARAGEAKFMNTAWTLQIIRGFMIYGVVVLLSLPLERFYEIEGLASILCVSSLGALIIAFLPTKIILQEKNLALKRIALFELIAQIAGAIAMVVIAYLYQSIWALVAGSLVSVICKLTLLTVGIPGRASHFAFDKTAFIELWRFGRWIFLSTAAVFFVSQGDRLFLGKIFTPEVLGIYSIAIVFSMLISEMAEVIAVKFLSPLYRKFKDNDDDFYGAVKRVRRLGILAGFVVCFLMTQLGDVLITLLYDKRYAPAGTLLQVMAFGAFFRMLDATLRPLFMVFRDSFGSMVYQGVKGVLYVGGMMLGWYAGGGVGLLAAIALTPLCAYLFLLILLKRHGYSAWIEEASIICLSLVAIGGAWFLLGTFPLDAANFLNVSR